MAKNFEELLTLQPVVMKQLQTIFDKNRLAHAYILMVKKGQARQILCTFCQIDVM